MGTFRVHAVLVEDVDTVGLKPLRHCLRRPAFDVIGAGCSGTRTHVLPVSGPISAAEFGGDHQLVTDLSERLADQLLIGEGTVGLSRVKESNPTFVGAADDANRFRSFRRRTLAGSEAHRAIAQFGYFQRSKFACFHDADSLN